MTINDFKKGVQDIVENDETLMIHVSPDFQCDQSCGYPVSLCVSWEQGKAWLAPNEFILDESENIEDVWQGCADFGIKTCHDVDSFNSLLKQLGEDAYDTAYISPDDQDEGQVMQL